VKILIADDSAVMRRINKNILIENKIKEEDLLEAEDGEQALAMAKEQDVEMFLVDWNMPKLDGLEFVKQVRSMEKYATVPVIMITSEAAKYMVIEAIKAGVTNYVVKPIKGYELWKKLSQYIKKE
jgi:two-component system chemotaxis response regulator CheY